VQRDSVRTAMERLETLPDGSKLYVLFPMHAHEGHGMDEELDNLRKQGFIRIVVGEELFNLEEIDTVQAAKEEVFVLVDR
jgi:excinuclease UvrABC ATPase subunit